MNRNMLRHSISRVVVGAAILGLIPAMLPAAAMAQTEGSFERTLQVDGPVDLDVATGSGDITIRAGGDGEVQITGRMRPSSDWRRDTEQVAETIRALEQDPPIEQTGNTIRVGHIDDRDRREGLRISYEITVPTQTRAESHTGAGSQTIAGIAGPLDAGAGSGSLELTDIGGDVEANAGSGTVTIDGVEGDVEARTGSGSIRIDGLTGGLDARTGSGSITVEGVPVREWSLRAGSGTLTVDIPDDTAFDLRARTNSGGIDSDHPITVQGRMGRRTLAGSVRGGGVLLDLSTGSGSIRIR